MTAAKKEGSVTVYAAPEYQSFLVTGFEKAYPWAKINFSAQEPPEASTKFQAEVNAGVSQADVVSLKVGELAPFVTDNALAKVTVPNDKLVNPSLKDSQGFTHPVTETESALVYNTKLISSVPTNLKDLADPKWSGKLAFDDPINGNQAGPVLASERKILGDKAWKQWLAGLAKNKPALTDSSSTSFEDVLRGDRAMCICAPHDYNTAKAQGAPLGIGFYNQSGAGIIVAPTIFVVSAKAPDPAMAALFINWTLSPTGGQAGFISSGRSPVVKVPGGGAAVPSTVKEAPLFQYLGDYYNNPDPYNAAFKQYFN